jgi:carboxymethylenebutenolidase
LEHLAFPPVTQSVSLEELTNTRIPGPPRSGIEILAYVAKPSNYNGKPCLSPPHVLILIHEFFGLSKSIVDKAEALASDLGCVVIAPDTFRGTVTRFIPKAIWLALTTPQDRVNDDLDAICSYIDAGNLFSGLPEQDDKEETNTNNTPAKNGGYKVAVMGFCYGGGKAIRYTTQRKNDAATVIFYGSPVTNTDDLRKLRAPVCAVYGRNDAQFSMTMLEEFQAALNEAKVDNTVRIYDEVGHAFWKDMEQIKRGEEPQTSAYKHCTDFLRQFFHST